MELPPKLADLALGLKRRYNHDVKYIDLGGGFPSRNTLKGSYLPGVRYQFHLSTSLRKKSHQRCQMLNFRRIILPLLILETGRAMIDDAAFLLGTVISNKRSSIGKRITIIDVG
jgi:diaminopimelate decarboxylase